MKLLNIWLALAFTLLYKINIKKEVLLLLLVAGVVVVLSLEAMSPVSKSRYSLKNEMGAKSSALKKCRLLLPKASTFQTVMPIDNSSVFSYLQSHPRLVRSLWSLLWTLTNTAPPKRWLAQSTQFLPRVTSSGIGSWRRSAPTTPGE